MAPLSIASVIAALVLSSPSPAAPPAPQPALKTIVTVHSSQFCTALEKSVRPALAELMHNDRAIEIGHATFVAAGNRIKQGGGTEAPAGEIIGPPTYSPSEADTLLVESRQRRLAKSIEDNVETIETILSDKKRFSTVPAGDESAKLSAIQSQLNAIAGQQRVAVNIISGQVEGAELVSLYNKAPSFGGADATHGVSPLAAMEANHGFDYRYIYDVWQAAQETRVPFYDPYLPFTEALAIDQKSIADAEDAASKSIIEAAGGCK